ncbi:glycosyltransferase family 39 protein [candidate division WOR-3 bacterium]|nr:glycosyltransferase family 39 protein [candidate division WOR-3 bacterium]
MVTKSIVEEHRIWTTERYFGFRRSGERCYSQWGIGQSILSIPLYLAGKSIAFIIPNLKEEYTEEFMVSLLNVIVTALTCVIILLFGVNLGYSVKNSVSLSLIYGFGNYTLVYAKDSMDLSQVALFILAAYFTMYLYIRYKRKKWLVISGLCFGFAIITRLTCIILLPLFLAYLFLSNFKIHSPKQLCKNLIILIITLSPFLIFIFYYNHIAFGSILKTGYGSMNELFTTPIYLGIYGLLLSPGWGILFYMPVAIVSIIFWKLFHRKDNTLSILFTLTILFYILFYAKYIYCQLSFGAWGNRFLIPIVAFFILPLGALFESEWLKRKHFVKNFVIAIILAGFFIQIPAVLVNYNRYTYFLDTKFSNIEKSKTLLSNPKWSPIVRQWQMCGQVITKMRHGTPWNLSLHNTGFTSTEILEKSRTMNIIDIWYIHLYYLGFPLIIILILLIVHITALLFLAIMCVRKFT